MKIATDMEPHEEISEDSEALLNLWELQISLMVTGDKNVLIGDHCEQGLTKISEYSKSLPELQREGAVDEINIPQSQPHQGVQDISNTQVTYRGNSSESS